MIDKVDLAIVTSIFFLILLIFQIVIVNRHRYVGEVQFWPNRISLKSNKTNDEIMTSDLRNLHIEYGGYSGEARLKFSGLFNYQFKEGIGRIFIETKVKRLVFKFLSNKERNYKILLDTIQYYCDNGVEATISNK